MVEVKILLKTLRSIYTTKYIALNILLAIIYYLLFLYLAYIQGGGAIMLSTSIILIFGLIVTSSITSTVAIYSIANTRRNQAKTSGTIASLGTLVTGTGLCGCTTTFPAVIAAGIGVSNTGVYALGGFLKNNNPYIFSLLIMANILVTGYYLNKFSNSQCKINKL